MTLMNFRRPKCVVLQEGRSYSGKYVYYYGYHWVAGKHCYDVGAINQANGQITTRHYKEEDSVNAKAEALKCYHEYKQGFDRKPDVEEYDERVFKRDVN